MFQWLILLFNCLIFYSGFAQSTNNDQKAKSLFHAADHYLDIELYDSAQQNLNQISILFAPNELNIYNYYLYSRRAEIDYYNSLNQLGITNATRSLNIAKQLNDKILLQDAYNLLSLFYIGLDSLKLAKHYSNLSINHIVSPPYPSKYLAQSMPHHIYGNMAEVHEKYKHYDSALYFSKKSLHEALLAKNERGISIAYNSISRIYFLNHNTDSALNYYQIAINASIASKDKDIELLNYGGIANVYAHLDQFDKADSFIQNGLILIVKYPEINTTFKREFLKSLRVFYLQKKDVNQLLKTTESLLNLEENIRKKHFKQVQFILNNSLANEARYLAANLKQVEKSKQLQINQLYIVILILVLLGILMAFYQYSVKEKLKLSILKNKISQDLHDDVGASLSSINMSAALAEKLIEVNPEKAKVVLKNISNNAEDGISTLSDIVWAMKPISDNSTSFESKVKNYAYHLLSVNDIACTFKIANELDIKLINIELRKNLLLIIKEAFNNIGKHSKANQVHLSINLPSKDKLSLSIQDNGIGFDKFTQKQGNGLHNMQKRTLDINGEFSIDSNPNNGCTINILFKL